jgi:hypothetical protein
MPINDFFLAKAAISYLHCGDVDLALSLLESPSSLNFPILLFSILLCLF